MAIKTKTAVKKPAPREEDVTEQEVDQAQEQEHEQDDTEQDGEDTQNAEPRPAPTAGATAVVDSDEGRKALETQKRGGPVDPADEAARNMTTASGDLSKGDMTGASASAAADGKKILVSPEAVNRLPVGEEFYAAFVYNPKSDDRRNAERRIDQLRSGRMIHRNLPQSFWEGDWESKAPLARRTDSGWELV